MKNMINRDKEWRAGRNPSSVLIIMWFSNSNIIINGLSTIDSLRALFPVVEVLERAADVPRVDGV